MTAVSTPSAVASLAACLKAPRRPEEVNDLGAPDEVELCQRRDPFPIERGLEAEVEAFECLDWQQLGRAQGDVDPARLAGGVFLAEQAVDRLDRGDLTRLELPHRVIEWALLRKSALGLTISFPVPFQATASISALPRAEKRFMMAMRIWISAVWRSGSRDMIRSPKSFRQFICASTRLRTW